jgi:hypothetical protein
MKKRITRILGAGLVIALVASLLMVPAPASAGTLSWGDEDIPDELTTEEITAIAFGMDGETIYAGLDDDTLHMSDDGGRSWSGISEPSGLGDVDLLAVAPDDVDIVVVIDGTNVWVSDDGGSSWSDLGVPEDADDGEVMTAIYAVAISRERSGCTTSPVAVLMPPAALYPTSTTAPPCLTGSAPWTMTLMTGTTTTPISMMWPTSGPSSSPTTSRPIVFCWALV